MTIDSLKAALDPASIAIVGASENPNKIGGRPLKFLQTFGYKGKVWPINPARNEAQGLPCFPSIESLPEAPDMAIVVVPGPPGSVQAGLADLVLQEVMADAAWVHVAVDRPGRPVRFRRFERPFHIGHAGKEPKPTDVTLGLRAVRQAARAFATPARVAFMYHHGYAGSTFLCRLLDTPGVCLGYAEPNVHFHHYDDPDMRALCRRTTAPGETALMKTLPGEMKNAARHFADNEGARGLYLYAPLEDYIASTLRHGYRREYVSAMARNLLGVECDDPGEAAVTWWTWAAREAIALAASRPLRVLAADDFYADVEGAAARVWDWYGFAPRTDWSATIRAVGSTHSKNRSPFSAEDRRV